MTIAATKLGEASATSITTPLGSRITIGAVSPRMTIFAGTSAGTPAPTFASRLRHQ
jgi:hypothetical protein